MTDLDLHRFTRLEDLVDLFTSVTAAGDVTWTLDAPGVYRCADDDEAVIVSDPRRTDPRSALAGFRVFIVDDDGDREEPWRANGVEPTPEMAAPNHKVTVHKLGQLCDLIAGQLAGDD